MQKVLQKQECTLLEIAAGFHLSCEQTGARSFPLKVFPFALGHKVTLGIACVINTII